ncbi:MAG: hypothetical protein U0Q16_37780 [Bryobacteraceae bacterium]
MARRTLQAAVGLGVGLVARFALPGHYPANLLVTAVLSLSGALVSGMAADWLLPVGTRKQGGFAMSALGALAMLLIYGVAAEWGRM